MAIQIEIPKTQYPELMNKIFKRIAFGIQAELTKTCPVDKGGLKISIVVRKVGKGYEIRMVDYWKYVEYGTPPHIIKPKDMKALRWNNQKGSVARKPNDIFAKVVHHPGTRPQPFVRNMLRNKLQEIVNRAVASV